MSYYPKSKIITNLYTNGGEYIIIETNQEYTGYYHKTYDGKFFTGKTPNDPPVNEIVKLVDSNIIVDVNKPTTELYVTLSMRFIMVLPSVIIYILSDIFLK